MCICMADLVIYMYLQIYKGFECDCKTCRVKCETRMYMYISVKEKKGEIWQLSGQSSLACTIVCKLPCDILLL